MNHRFLLDFQNRYVEGFAFLNQCAPVLLGVFIFCNPFPYTTAITNICFYLTIMIVLVLIVFKRSNFIFKTPLTYPLVLFFLWSFLSVFWSLNMENSIYDVRGHLLNHIVLYFLVINIFCSRKRFVSLAWIVVASATIFSIVGMLYYYIIMDNPFFAIRLGHLYTVNDNNIVVSTELPVNFVGTLTIFAILICLHFSFLEDRLHRHVAIITCSILLFVATLLTQSRGTLLSLMIAITIILSLKNKNIVLLFLLVMVLIVILTPLKGRLYSGTFEERMKINYFTYEVVKDYPIMGIGFGMQTFTKNIDKELYINRVPKEYRPTEEIYTPHNLLLDIAVRTGLIGLSLFLYVIFVFGKMCWETIRYARDDGFRNWGICLAISFVAYFIIGMAEPVFLFSASAMVFYIILAMITILWRLNHEELKKLCA